MALIDTAKIGKLGGKKRAANMTPEERTAGARDAANARWGKKRAEAGGGGAKAKKAGGKK